MLIRARFFGELKEYVGKGWTTVELPGGSSVYDFILKLAQAENPSLLEKLMEGQDRIRSGFTILVNGRNIAHLDGLKTELKDHDLVSILPVAGGGISTGSVTANEFPAIPYNKNRDACLELGFDIGHCRPNDEEEA